MTNVSLSGPDTSAGTVKVEFDIAWENSWRNSLNRDAAWVFIKYSEDGGITWNHATLKSSGTNPSNFSTGTGTAVDLIVPNDLKGAFIERASEGGGTLSTTDVQLVWDYNADSLSATDTVRVKVFGLEMVYVPQGSFYAGDNNSSTATFKQGSADTDPWRVISSSSISVTNSVSNGFYYQSSGASGEDSTGSSFTISASFPNGYNAFYLMKHELTEGQWVEFFNSLTNAQKLTRDITSPVGKNSDATVNRNTVSWSSGSATTQRPDRACSYLSWMDSAAFADWAALRPMTELEFEKAARGVNVSAVSSEYVWGTTEITQAAAISGSEDGTEAISIADANANYNSAAFAGGDGGSGPLRAGIFATSESTRTAAGAGFYGAMELAGNLSEHLVTVGNSDGRSFIGSHGDGELTTLLDYEGNATNTDWPGIDATIARGVTGASGSGFRGGSWSSASSELQTSDRSNAATLDSDRQNNFGFRAVRTAS